MRLKTKYILYQIFIFGMMTALVIYVFHDNLLRLFIAEGIILLLIMLSAWMFRAIFKPLDQIRLGVETIKSKDFTVKIQTTGNNEIDEVLEVYNQLIENIRKERTFQKEQHFFLDKLIENLPIPFFILDFDDRLESFNSKAESTFNLNAGQIGEKMNEILPFEINQKNSDKLIKIENNYFRLTGNTFVHKGFYKKFILIEEVSREVFNIEKKSYDKVIRMMAHEVKNSVGAINSMLENVKIKEENEKLQLVINRNKSLNQFVNNFAKVVRIPDAVKVRTDLNSWLQKVVESLKEKANNQNVDLQLNLPKETVFAEIDPILMEQVVINMIINSLEAQLPESKEPIIINLKPNQIVVIDQGMGIKEEEKDLLFTPFYSTKPQGQGVGLTMIKDILTKHQFPFKLYSRDGQTFFEIHF